MAEPYAEVAVSLPLRETFHYRIPAALRKQAQPGVRTDAPGKSFNLPIVVAARRSTYTLAFTGD